MGKQQITCNVLEGDSKLEKFIKKSILSEIKLLLVKTKPEEEKLNCLKRENVTEMNLWNLNFLKMF